MKPPKSVFVCQQCGSQSPKWLGRCPDCSGWNSFVEERTVPVVESRGAVRAMGGTTAQLYEDVDTVVSERIGSGSSEFDRVLGGIVPGSPLCWRRSRALASRPCSPPRPISGAVGPVLYCSGEESEHQIKMRGERLGVGKAPLYLLAETCVERLLEEVDRLRPALLIVDSIQTVFSMKLQSAPGSVGQVRQAATDLLFTAKGRNAHDSRRHVTKDGSLAGPKALEHVVDTVLYFEGERHHSHRVVRAVKNRFGAVSELGVFEMTSAGLRPVPNPSQLFLARQRIYRCHTCTIEGRPILVKSRRS
jgi:DNA repair protein RadA/Sms